MAYNSSGVFSRVHDFTDDRDNGIRIQASRMDAEMDGIATGLSTAITKDGTQTTTAIIPFAVGLSIIDNQSAIFGTTSDYTLQYDEATRDSLMLTSNVEGAAFKLTLAADQGDDASDEWQVGISTSGVLTIGNDIASAQTYVSQLTLTPHATVASSTTAVLGNLTVGGDLTVTGDDITMATNTAGHVLVGDGTNYNPVAISGDVTLASSGAITIASGSVETAMIAADAITSAKIADDAINSEHYTDGSIDTAHIANSQITVAKMAANSVDSDQYVDGSIDTAHIANLQITTGLIAADAITADKIADDVVNSEHYAAGSIDTEHIADSQVTVAKMADNSIDSDQYVDGSIDTAHISDNAVTLAKMAGIARGKFIIGDASGNPAVIGPGTNAQVLTSDGTDIAFAAVPGASALAADNLTIGDAAILLTTSSGNITIDAAANDSDIIFKGTDGGVDTTYLTIDGSAAGAVDMATTLAVGGVVTANAGVVVDTITIDAGEIDQSSGDLTIDIASDLIIDVDDGRIFLKDGGTTFGRIANNSTNLDIVSTVADKDIIFKGNDGGAEITALTLDMSDAGSAIFNHDIKLADNGKAIFGTGGDLEIYHDASNSYIADEGTGNLIISSGGITFKNQARDETYATMTVNGAVALYFNNVARLATVADGVTTTGINRTVANNAGAYAMYVHSDGNVNDRYGLAISAGTDDASGTNYLIGFQDGDGNGLGAITFSGGTVTYGAFTAFHPCIIPNADNDADSTDNAYPYGTLLEISSLSYKQKNGANTERGLLYNVQKSSSAKSKAVIGAYGSSMNGGPDEETNMHQTLILGDGHILCNNENGNIAIGDYICTSSASGEGMKATSICITIGVAREAISFTNSTAVLVAVEYGYRQFVPEDLEARITALENA